MDDLFSRAIEAYVAANDRDAVTVALDEHYSEETCGLDEVVAQMQWASLPREDW